MSPATGIGIATLALMVTLTIVNLWTWWKAGRRFAMLKDGIAGILLGISAATCTDGWIGDFASRGAGAVNTLSAVVPWTTGTTDQPLPTGQVTGLQEGSLIVLPIVVIGAIALRVALTGSDNVRKWRLAGGTVIGFCLIYTPLGASFTTNYLIPFYNAVGAQIIDAVRSVV